jgi:hypothetical protein
VVWRSLDRKEARISYRFRSHLDIPVRLTFMGSDGLDTSREHFARNLNRSGVSVTLDEAIVPGTTVCLELWLPEHTVKAEAEVVRNHVYRLKEKGAPRTSNGMRFTSISATDQDEISKYLFWEIAPRESAMLNLTHGTQAEDMA